jgi:DNA-binding transcriptional LysR family regulator
MDFRHVRAFIAVADALSVTKAAARLHISQPPLSRHIHQLENELGITLFVRHRQGVTLTEVGRRLLEKAKALDAAASDFQDTARHAASGESNRLRIGIAWGLFDPVNRIRAAFAKRYPDVTIEAKEAYCSTDVHERLRDHSVDVVFARPPFDTAVVAAAPIFHERLQAVLSDASPLAAAGAVWIRDLANVPLLLWDRDVAPVLYDKMLDLYASAGVAPTMIPTPGAGPYNHAGLMLVASGKGTYLGLGIPLTSLQPPSGVAVRPVGDPDATIEVCVVSRKAETSPIVAQFLECVWCVFPQEAPVPETPVLAKVGAYSGMYAKSR